MVTSVALLCASLAWAGWVYLHTVGDVHRAEKIATAVLDDPDANRQVATAITDQLMSTLLLEPAQRPMLRGAVEDSLHDPRVSAQVISAFGAAHANALGVDDPRPTTIDGAALVATVRENLAVVAPEVAALIPDGVVGDVTLPKVHPPGVGAFRRAAESGTTALAVAAVLLSGVALVFGDRRRTVRRLGIWGISSGLLWMVVPYLVRIAAKAWAPSVSAIVAVAARESASAVLPAAIVLVAGGAIAVVVSFVPNLFPDDQRSVVRTTTRPVYANTSRSSGPPATARAQPAAQPAAGRGAPADTFVRSGETTSVVYGTATHPPAQPTPRPPVPPSDQVWQPTERPTVPPTGEQPSGEFDPWSHYFGPESSN